MKKGKIIIISAAVIGVAGIGLFALSGGNKNSPVMTDTLIGQKLQKQDLTDSINITGSIGGDEIAVGNSQSSVCIDIKVNNGDHVEKGDVLFIFDSSDLQSEYDKALERFNAERDKAAHYHSENEKQLQKAKDVRESALSQAQSDIDYAEKLLNDTSSKKQSLTEERDRLNDRKNELSEQITDLRNDEESDPTELEMLSKEYESILEQLVSTESQLSAVEESISSLERQVSQAKVQYDNVKFEQDSHVSSAEENINEETFQVYSIEQSDLDSIQAKIDSCVVKAPASGIVSDIMVCKGAIAMGSELAKIINTSDYHVKASVSENRLVKLKTGMDVAIRTLATGDEDIPGVISSISSYGNVTENGINYAVDIDVIDDKLTELPPLNMTANIKIIQNVIPDAYAVPYDAVLSDDGKSYILTAVPENDKYKLKRVYVEKGITTNFLSEITGSELCDDMIVVTIPEDCDEGDIVDIDLG